MLYTGVGVGVVVMVAVAGAHNTAPSVRWLIGSDL